MAERSARCELFKKIDEKIRKTGYDQSFIEACKFHLNIISHYQNEENIKNRDDLYKLVMSKLFIDKIDMYPEKKFKCEVNEDSNWPVPLLPVEFFCKLPDEFRIDCFYEFLKVEDILDCRVASILPSEYILRVIHKHNSTKILDDLNIMVKLSRSGSKHVKNEFMVCELVAVVVSEISKTDEKIDINVTLKKSDSTKEKVEDEELLPFYVLDRPDTEKYSSYACYLKSKPQFSNPTMLKAIFSEMGVDTKKIYSYYPKYNGLKCSRENSAQELLNKSKLNDAKNYAFLATEEYEKKHFNEALRFINKALELCPKKDPLKVPVYRIRADIFKALHMVKECGTELIIANYIDPNNEQVNKRISSYFYRIGNGYYRNKKYKVAFTYAELALEEDKNDTKATALLEYLKKNHPKEVLENPEAVLEDLDEESLPQLQKKKKELVSKLKKYEEEKQSLHTA